MTFSISESSPRSEQIKKGLIDFVSSPSHRKDDNFDRLMGFMASIDKKESLSQEDCFVSDKLQEIFSFTPIEKIRNLFQMNVLMAQVVRGHFEELYKAWNKKKGEKGIVNIYFHPQGIPLALNCKERAFTDFFEAYNKVAEEIPEAEISIYVQLRGDQPFLLPEFTPCFSRAADVALAVTGLFN